MKGGKFGVKEGAMFGVWGLLSFGRLLFIVCCFKRFNEFYRFKRLHYKWNSIKVSQRSYCSWLPTHSGEGLCR